MGFAPPRGFASLCSVHCSTCSPGHKGHDDLTSSPPSSGLSPAVSPESPTMLATLATGVALVAGLNPTSHDFELTTTMHTCLFSIAISASLEPLDRCQDLVRFFALLRIKPLCTRFVSGPVNSLSFILANVLLRRSTYCVNCSIRFDSQRLVLSSFTAWTTRVSNPICSPRFSGLSVSYAPDRRLRHHNSVPPYIYAFHRLHMEFHDPSHTLALSFRGFPSGFDLSPPNPWCRLLLFTPNNFRITLSPIILPRLLA